MQRLMTLFVLLCATALAVPGCGDDPIPTAPTPPPNLFEPITGTLTPFSVRIHPFTVYNAGTVTATLNTLTPNDPLHPTLVGLDLGTFTGSACQVTVSDTQIFASLGISGTATTPATLCVRIYDVSPSGLAEPVTYTITVGHF
jgi:hypothetical protein